MPDVSEPEMKLYLLGGLSPERQTELATQIHGDAELQEELLAVEEELFDHYLAGSLTADEQRSFQTHFLSTERGQQKLHFATLFREYRDSHSQEEPFAVQRVPAPNPPVPDPSPWFPSFHQNPAYAVSLIVVSGLLATLVIWVSVKQSTTHPAMQAKPPLTLRAGSIRSGGSISELRAPAKNDRVKLELEIAKADFKKYKTQLFRENEAVESQEELQTIPKNAHFVVPVTVTGVLLTPGDYQLRLSGVPDSGQPEFIDSYAFRVTPEPPADSDSEPDRTAR
jgi:hypothetical protein